MGIVNTLGSFVYRTTYASLSRTVIDATKDRILDFLGGALFESNREMVKPLFKTLKGYGGSKESSVVGRKEKLPCPLATFINSGMAFDTGDIPHTGVMAIASALAMSEVEAKTRVISGKDLILSIVLGYEVAMRVEHAMIPSPFARKFDPTGIVGPLAAASSAGKILGLDEVKMANALSISSSLGIGSIEASRPPRPFILIQVGRACEAGVLSALLAKEGIQGSDTMLEKGFVPTFSERLQTESIEKDLGKDFGISKTAIKLHGGCRCLHTPVDTIDQIASEYKITLEDIERIRVKVCPGTITEDLDLEYPENAESARFSTPFALASFLVYGDAFQDKFTDAHLKNPHIQNLIHRTTVERSPELAKQSPLGKSVIIEIVTRDGKSLSRRSDFAKGDREWPMTTAEIETKFNRMASGALNTEERQRIISYIRNLENTYNLSDLFPLLRASQTQRMKHH